MSGLIVLGIMLIYGAIYLLPLAPYYLTLIRTLFRGKKHV